MLWGHLPNSADPQRDLLAILGMSPTAVVDKAVTKTFATQAAADETAAFMRPWWGRGEGPPAERAGGPPARAGRAFPRQRDRNRTEAAYAITRPLVAAVEEPSTPLPAAENYLAALAKRPSEAQVRSHQVAGAGARPLLYLLLREAWPLLKSMPVAEFNAFVQALDLLKSRPVADLEALTTDVLDACTHRLDAWITGIAAARLR